MNDLPLAQIGGAGALALAILWVVFDFLRRRNGNGLGRKFDKLISLVEQRHEGDAELRAEVKGIREDLQKLWREMIDRLPSH